MPNDVSVLLPGSQYLIVVRVLRVLRIFWVLKLVHYVREASVLGTTFRASGRKIIVFLFSVVTLVVIFESLIYLVGGGENGFTNDGTLRCSLPCLRLSPEHDTNDVRRISEPEYRASQPVRRPRSACGKHTEKQWNCAMKNDPDVDGAA